MICSVAYDVRGVVGEEGEGVLSVQMRTQSSVSLPLLPL